MYEKYVINIKLSKHSTLLYSLCILKGIENKKCIIY